MQGKGEYKMFVSTRSFTTAANYIICVETSKNKNKTEIYRTEYNFSEATSNFWNGQSGIPFIPSRKIPATVTIVELLVVIDSESVHG